VLLLEIAAQGIKGVAPSGGRLALRPGYNVVASDGVALRRLVEALLWPGPRDGDEVPRAAPGPGGGPARAGVTLVGNDQVTYRVVRDFAAGCQLHRFDAERRAFTPVSSDLAEIGAFLAGTAGVPARTRFLALLRFSAAELPSRSASAGLGGLSAAPAPARRAASPAEAQKRLGELRVELERARQAEKLQYRLDGLQSRLFKLEEALREGARLREELNVAEAALAALGPVDAVAGRLGDPAGRAAAFARSTAKREEALARVAEEREAADLLEGQGTPPPFWLSPGFLGGAGAGLALLVVGVVGAAQHSSLRYLALLDIPAFGAAAWAALRQVEELEARSRLGRRRKVVEERERKAVEQWERETADLRGACKELGLGGVPELLEAVGKLAAVRQARDDLRGRLDAWEAQPDTRGAQDDRAAVEGELREVEAALSAEAGGYVRDPRSVEVEIARLEQEASAPPEPVEAAPAVAAPPSTLDPLRALLERAGAELAQSPTAVARGLQAKAAPFLSGLSGQRLAALSVDDRGNLLAGPAGRPQPVLGMPAADRDLVFLALRLALVEQALAGGKAVAVAEDAFAALPEGARRLAGRMLKQVARAGQLLHATRDAAFREAADHSA
jgi:hypothetical protein